MINCSSSISCSSVYYEDTLGHGDAQSRTTNFENLEDIAVSDQVHSNGLRTALLHGRRDGAKDRAGSLARLVPALNFLSVQRIAHLWQSLRYLQGSDGRLVPSPGRS